MKFVEFGTDNTEVVLLLHGGGLSWWNYRYAAGLLRDRFRVILPVLDGHADSEYDFTSIEKCAAHVIELIDQKFGGKIMLLGGLSLGAQVAVEILARRWDICRFAVIESASVIPSRFTNALIRPTFSASFGLVRRKWFAKMQFRYLRIRKELFDDYYRDTCLIAKENMIRFLCASTMYHCGEKLKKCSARVRIVAGGREQRSILKSARALNKLIPDSSLDIKKGFYHGEYSINQYRLFADDIIALADGDQIK